MKKSRVIKIILISVLIILLINIIYHIFYFQNFQRNTKIVSDFEEQKILSILNKNLDITNYEIIFGRIYSGKDRELISIKIINEQEKKYYLIDLKSEEILSER